MQGSGENSGFATPLHHRPIPASAHPSRSAGIVGEGEAEDPIHPRPKHVHDLGATIASEVVKALNDAQLVNLHSVATKLGDAEVVHVGPITLDFGRREATLRGRELLKPSELGRSRTDDFCALKPAID